VKFMLFIYPDRTVQLNPEQRAAIPEAVSGWIEEMDGRGVRLEGHVLAPASEAATVKVRGGDVVRGSGPATDAAVQVSGFNILDCTDLDEALEVAAKHPVAAFGVLELRAFVDA
jgi:hypothetical protein